MLCQPKSPELPSAEATWLRARRAAGLPERTGLPLRSRWRNGSRFSAHEWNAWTYTFDKTTWDACQQGIPDGQIPTGDPLASVCPECTNPTSFCPCEYGQPAGTAEYVDPVLTYLVCWAVFGVWPTLFVLYKLLQ